MTNDPFARPPEERPSSPRAINVPAVVLVLIAAFALVHLVRTQFLSDYDDAWTLANFALIADCYRTNADICGLREPWANAVSPLTHAFLHGDWTHFGANAIWLLAFGTPVARRLGAGRFLVFSAVGALCGAALFWVLNQTLLQPMIGASGVVSALMGGAARFALAPMVLAPAEAARAVPRLGIVESLRDRTVLFFVAIFFVTNVALGSSAGFLLGEGASIAWEAHLGGFLFGFLCFAPFDPWQRRR